MTYTAATYAEARQIAKQLRGYGYRVEIVKPLFDGDTYRVNAI
jgi:hypothetical protein